jgi:hypothetical protein
MGALEAACQVAFADNLQTMEEIGFFVRNQPKPKTDEEPTEPPIDPGNTGEPGTAGEPEPDPDTNPEPEPNP